MFFGIGAYSTILLFNSIHLTPWIGMLVGGAIAAAISLLLVPTFRLKGLYFGLCTFAFTLIVLNLTVHYHKFTGGDGGISMPLLGSRPELFQFENPVMYYYVVIGFVVVFFAVSSLVYKSRLGIYLQAIRDDEGGARASGVPVVKVKIAGVVISAFMTGIMGAVYTQVLGFIDPSSAFGYAIATQIAIYSMAGGIGTLWGPILGAGVLYPLQR